MELLALGGGAATLLWIIAAILVIILLANALTPPLTRAPFALLYLALAATLLFNYGFSLDTLNRLGWTSRLVIGGAVTAAPLFFAALIFSKAFSSVGSPAHALASNLFGCLVGGALEYLDMWVGLRGLNLVALALYAISFAVLVRRSAPALAGVEQAAGP